jgi:hypothetical protein
MRKILLAGAVLLVFSALSGSAQQTTQPSGLQSYTFRFSRAETLYIISVLQDQRFRDSATVLNSMQGQINAEEAADAVKNSPSPPVPPAEPSKKP